jgi:hypothetical protein
VYTATIRRAVMATKRGSRSLTAGRLKAAGNMSPGRFWSELVAKLRAYADEHGTRMGDFAHVEMSATKLFRDEFGLGGSHVRAIQVFQRARVMVLMKHNLGGRHGRVHSTRWAVDMVRNFELREFIEASEAIYQDQERERQHRAREARIAGPDVPEQTTGGPVTERHDHTWILEHAHPDPGQPGGERSGPHSHHEPTPERPAGIRWLKSPAEAWTEDDYRQWLVSANEGHEEEQTHQHGPRAGRHFHGSGPNGPTIHWIEWRHHTHTARTAEPNGTGTVTREVTEELAGGHAAILERSRVAPAKRPGETTAENQHRRLMEIIVRYEARIAELELAVSSGELQRTALREELEGERKERLELERLLEKATDPATAETEAFLAEREK